MNRQKYGCCRPERKKRKQHCFAKKAGIAMLALGIVTVFALVLPPEYWVMLLSIVLVVLGIMLLKKS